MCYIINIILVLNITVDDIIAESYIDGVEITDLPNRYDYKVADSVPLPSMTQVIAVKQSNSASNGGLLASSKFMITDERWKVTVNYTAGWMNATFDDSAWDNATVYKLNKENSSLFVVPGISSSSAWITTKKRTEHVVYFRYRIKHCDQ